MDCFKATATLDFIETKSILEFDIVIAMVDDEVVGQHYLETGYSWHIYNGGIRYNVSLEKWMSDVKRNFLKYNNEK